MSVTTDQFFDWLEAQGADRRFIMDVRFTPAGVRGGDTPVVMQVTTYARNEKGERYLITELNPEDNSSTRRVATEVRMIPLESLPGVGMLEPAST